MVMSFLGELCYLLIPMFFIYFQDGFTTSVLLEPCFPAFKGQSCNMTCRVPNFAQVIDFKCNGTSRGTCLPNVYCNPSITTEGADTLYFQIPSLSYASDICDWSCTHGSASSPVSKPIILSKLF